MTKKHPSSAPQTEEEKWKEKMLTKVMHEFEAKMRMLKKKKALLKKTIVHKQTMEKISRVRAHIAKKFVDS